MNMIYNYIADTIKNTERTIRMSNLLAVSFCGLLVGSFLGDVILEIGNFSTVFAATTALIFMYAASILLLLPYDKLTPLKMTK